MTYQELKKSAESVYSGAKTEVLALDGSAYKLFDKNFPPHYIFQEAMFQSLAAEAGLNVPKMHGVIKADNRFAAVSDYIEGFTVEQLLEENPAKQDYYLDLLAEAQLSINSVYIEGLPLLRDKMTEDIEALDIDEVKKYELLTRLASMPQHKKLCHGNFGGDNVIIDGLDKPCTVDWSSACVGNSGADAATAYLKLSFVSTETAERYLTLFCQKSGSQLSYLREWIPLAAACGLKYKNIAGRERDLLLSWLDVG